MEGVVFSDEQEGLPIEGVPADIDNADYGAHDEAETGEDGPVLMDEGSPEGEYQPHWGASTEGGGGEDEDEEIPFVDDLPIFADNSSKALHEETKSLEKRRDATEKVRQGGASRMLCIIFCACTPSLCFNSKFRPTDFERSRRGERLLV